MDTYVLQLAMAALVGASTVAISAYFLHRKTLLQLLELAREGNDDDDDVDLVSAADDLANRGGGRVRRKVNGYLRRGSSSLPDVTVMSEEEKRNGQVTVQGIPAGLPQLHAVHQGTSKRKTARPISPKSPVASARAFDSVEESDDDDVADHTKLDTTYLHTNGDVGPEVKNQNQPLFDYVNANGEQISIAVSSMIHSHSVSGDLYDV